MGKIDKDVVDDIVGLIDAEMGEVASGRYVYAPERLAGVILGRLGYEVEPPSPFPDITPGDWNYRTKYAHASYELYSDRPGHNDTERILGRGMRKVDAKLMAAAPKLMKAAYAAFQEIQHGCQNRSIDKLVPALREAGVKL